MKLEIATICLPCCGIAILAIEGVSFLTGFGGAILQATLLWLNILIAICLGFSWMLILGRE